MRCTILTASIGAGHDLPAEILAAELRAEYGWEVDVADVLVLAGRSTQRLIASGSTYDSRWGNRLFDLQHRLLHDIRTTRRIASRLADRLAGEAVLRHLQEQRSDVVVSTYPGSTEVLGRMRGTGRLPVPAVAVITDLAALHFWAHPEIDLHLVTQVEAIAEVRRVAGSEAEVVHVRGLDDPRFADPPPRARARDVLGLAPEAPVVVVSGGGWAVGDLAGATEEALAVDPGTQVLVLCGTNDELRKGLDRRFAASGRVRTMGFTDRMPEVLSAADVLIHSTAGLTVMEALVVGCRVISYGWGRGHIRLNNEAFLRHGLAAVAHDRFELRAALADALAGPRSPDPSFATLPRAATVIAGLPGLPVASEDHAGQAG